MEGGGILRSVGCLPRPPRTMDDGFQPAMWCFGNFDRLIVSFFPNPDELEKLDTI